MDVVERIIQKIDSIIESDKTEIEEIIKEMNKIRNEIKEGYRDPDDPALDYHYTVLKENKARIRLLEYLKEEIQKLRW